MYDYTKEALNVVSTLCLDEDEVDPKALMAAFFQDQIMYLYDGYNTVPRLHMCITYNTYILCMYYLCNDIVFSKD